MDQYIGRLTAFVVALGLATGSLSAQQEESLPPVTVADESASSLEEDVLAMLLEAMAPKSSRIYRLRNGRNSDIVCGTARDLDASTGAYSMAYDFFFDAGSKKLTRIRSGDEAGQRERFKACASSR